MAKNNNKGFSLIEIIIAMAILTLLLTPIMRQFAATLETNRKAKEQQYANENAQYVLEYFQTSVDEALSNNVTSLPTSDTRTDAKGLYCEATARENKTVDCEIYSVITGSSTGEFVEYTASKFTLNDVKLGAKQSVYNRTVIVDDLSLCLREEIGNTGNSYNVVFDLPENSDIVRNLVAQGFEYTNEGSLVRRDADGYIDGIVTILNTTAYADNPNKVNLGNIQDLDSSKVALINGDTADFDAQAEEAFYAMAMDELKKLDEDTWDQIMHNKVGVGLWDTVRASSGSGTPAPTNPTTTEDEPEEGTPSDAGMTLADPPGSKAITKLTKLSVYEVTSGTETYYQVDAYVYYENNYTLKPGTVAYSYTDSKYYPVYSQKFKTDRCPDIYFEYQPYTESVTKNAGGTYTVEYAENDYILLDVRVEDVNLYLYKPDNHQMEQADLSSSLTDTSTYFTDSTCSTKVNIHVADSKQLVGTDTSDTSTTKIYTNIDTTQIKKNTNLNVAFATNPGSQADDEKTFLAAWNRGAWGAYAGSIEDRTADVRYDSRLYTITVNLTPTATTGGANRVSLTGAKGEN